MRGPDVAKVSRRRSASKIASRVLASAHTPVSPAALSPASGLPITGEMSLRIACGLARSSLSPSAPG
ncbi:hypothetical protein D3C83_122600 [compost metagenome]